MLVKRQCGIPELDKKAREVEAELQSPATGAVDETRWGSLKKISPGAGRNYMLVRRPSMCPNDNEES